MYEMNTVLPVSGNQESRAPRVVACRICRRRWRRTARMLSGSSFSTRSGPWIERLPPMRCVFRSAVTATTSRRRRCAAGHCEWYYPYFLQGYGNAIWNLAPEAPFQFEDAELAVEVGRSRLDEGFFPSRWNRSTERERRYLEARGLVRRVRSTEDSRAFDIELTTEGRSRLRGSAPIHSAAARDLALSCLSADEVTSLGVLLARLVRGLDPGGPLGAERQVGGGREIEPAHESQPWRAGTVS